MYYLYEKGIEREWNNVRMQASFQGIDLDKAIREAKKEDRNLFKDPSEYKNLSNEEKEKLTEQMMKGHKHLFTGKDK